MNDPLPVPAQLEAQLAKCKTVRTADTYVNDRTKTAKVSTLPSPGTSHDGRTDSNSKILHTYKIRNGMEWAQSIGPPTHHPTEEKQPRSCLSREVNSIIKYKQLERNSLQDESETCPWAFKKYIILIYPYWFLSGRKMYFFWKERRQKC
jgi:hypothetical protein